MVTDENYHWAGVPTSILGCSYRSWRKFQLTAILDHYAEPYPEGASKLDLMKALHVLSQRQPLARRDKSRILNPRLRSAPLTRRGKSRILNPRLRSAPLELNDVDSPSPSNENAPIPDQLCTVCLERFEAKQFPGRKLTSACDHEPTICQSCLATSISTQLSSKIWDQIKCPDCDAGLEHQDIKDFADAETFQRYDHLALQSCLNSSHFQSCRMPGCDYVQECFADEDSFMTCPKCSGRTCIACDTILHTGVSCAEDAAQHAADELRSAQELASTQYLNESTKACPGCGAHSVKVSGCDHITCHRCSYQYCWICLANYALIRKDGNTQHHNDCKYHTSNISGDILRLGRGLQLLSGGSQRRYIV